MKSLDIDAVKAFVLVAQLQSFTRAAEVLDTTQSAISLRLGKLEQQLGKRLLERTPRHVRLSIAGLGFLEAAHDLIATHDRAVSALDVQQQRLVIGLSHELVGPQLPGILRHLQAQQPTLRFEFRIAGSRDLTQSFEQRELDAVLVFRPEQRRKQGKAAFTEPFYWFAGATWKPTGGRPLPLATQGPACRIRAAATRALDKADLDWEEVFLGKGAAIVGAAAAAGLALAPLARRTAPPGTVEVGTALSLPTIPPQDVMLYCALTDRRTRESLRALVCAFQM